MNYFIFKGINSKSISGLVVNTLPPITKAPQRVEIQEIDGMDGEVVTELGYSAYEKSITITLTNHDNIDEILAWLNGEGELITSLEPYKIYRARIVNQIDFDRTYNLKVATITFRVQPFKYDIYEIGKTFETIDKTEIEIRNKGNIYSKPTIVIYGGGDISLSLNDYQIFNINLTDEGYITIDTEKMEATKDGILKNRLVTGNYDNFKLNTGKNIISFTGNVKKIVISNYSRWI